MPAFSGDSELARSKCGSASDARFILSNTVPRSSCAFACAGAAFTARANNVAASSNSCFSARMVPSNATKLMSPGSSSSRSRQSDSASPLAPPFSSAMTRSNTFLGCCSGIPTWLLQRDYLGWEFDTITIAPLSRFRWDARPKRHYLQRLFFAAKVLA